MHATVIAVLSALIRAMAIAVLSAWVHAIPIAVLKALIHAMTISLRIAMPIAALIAARNAVLTPLRNVVLIASNFFYSRRYVPAELSTNLYEDL